MFFQSLNGVWRSRPRILSIIEINKNIPLRGVSSMMSAILNHDDAEDSETKLTVRNIVKLNIIF
jgi:hypothetical protein